MTLYSFVLFAHITAVLAMFACLSLEVLSLFRMRRAATFIFKSKEIPLLTTPEKVVCRPSRNSLGCHHKGVS